MTKEINIRNMKIKLDCISSAECVQDVIQYLDVTKQLKSQAMSRKEAALKQLLFVSAQEDGSSVKNCPNGQICKDSQETGFNLSSKQQYIEHMNEMKRYQPDFNNDKDDEYNYDLCVIYGYKDCNNRFE